LFCDGAAAKLLAANGKKKRNPWMAGSSPGSSPAMTLKEKRKMMGGRGAVVVVALLAWLGSTWPAAAQSFPAKPVKIVVPQAPGGATDVLARAIGQKLAERWGQPVVVENRGGAGGVIGTDFVAKAPADGSTLLMSYAGSQAINPSLYKTLPFDSSKDFETVATVATVPFLLVAGPTVEARDLRAFIALGKAKGEALTYASSGNGSVNHLLGEMLKTEAGFQMIHVPYKGVAASLTDVIGGRVDAAFASVPSVVGQVRAGAVRALAVSSAQRSPALPEVPTVAEAALPGFDVNPWWGLLAPAGTPRPTVLQLNRDIGEAVQSKEVQDVYRDQGATALLTSPEEFRRILEADIAKWAKVVEASGAKID
jgi:tripartite-type tricarboxylate transporter receptor subunit TctC